MKRPVGRGTAVRAALPRPKGRGPIEAYEPLIIDMPPVEPYKNEALEEKQKYRRLLVEAV